MRVKKICIMSAMVFSFACSFSGLAFSETPTTQSSAPQNACGPNLALASRIQCLEDLNTLLVAQLKVAKSEQSLDAQTGSENYSDKARNISIPNVLSIYGFGSEPLSAVLAYSDGRSLSVHQNEDIPGGFHVSVIDSNPGKVVLTKPDPDNGKVDTYVLLMGVGGQSINSDANQNGSLGNVQEDGSVPSTAGTQGQQNYPVVGPPVSQQ